MKLDIAMKSALIIGVFLIIGACGGGGSGAPPADVIGRIMLVSTGSPLTGAVVSVGGVSFTTLADGTFTIHNISSASTSLVVTGTGLQNLTAKIGPLTHKAVNDLGDIFVLQTADGGGYTATVSAQVVRADTLAILPNALVRLNGATTTSDVSGNFTITGLPVGLGATGAPVGLIKATNFEDKQIVLDFPLVASPPVNNLGQIQISPPVGGIPGGPTTINGRVRLSGFSDYSGTTVTLTDKLSGRLLSTEITAKDGLFGFWVQVGQYTVKFDHTGPPLFQSKTQDATLIKLDVPVTIETTLTP